jgi:hypothetical protein
MDLFHSQHLKCISSANELIATLKQLVNTNHYFKTHIIDLAIYRNTDLQLYHVSSGR